MKYKPATKFFDEISEYQYNLTPLEFSKIENSAHPLLIRRGNRRSRFTEILWGEVFFDNDECNVTFAESSKLKTFITPSPLARAIGKFY